MKMAFLFLGILAGLAVPCPAQANPDDQSTKKHDKDHSRVMVQAPRQQRRTIYYITSNTPAGSHIPTVVRQYHGQNEALNGGFLPDRFFTSSDTDRANGTSVAASLAKLDPAITVSH